MLMVLNDDPLELRAQVGLAHLKGMGAQTVDIERALVLSSATGLP
jgi:hypothetical protein